MHSDTLVCHLWFKFCLCTVRPAIASASHRCIYV